MNPTIPDSFRGYPVRKRTFRYAGREIVLLGPANFDALIDDPRTEQRFREDEYLPYWAEFWPACLVLADRVAGWPPLRDSDRPPVVLELGCGLGLLSLIAAARGYRVIASDYDEDALAFVQLSARCNGLPAPECRRIDWRQPQPGLRADRILAAEVLYETRWLEPIARFIAAHLAPDGVAEIVDRNRNVADAFPDVARAAGLRIETEPVRRQPDDHCPEPIEARIFRLTVSRSGR